VGYVNRGTDKGTEFYLKLYMLHFLPHRNTKSVFKTSKINYTSVFVLQAANARTV
jgi:hypothetical protein